VHLPTPYPDGLAPGLADEWDELARRTHASPFVRPEWVEPWLKWFGGALQPVEERRGSELAAFVPLVRRRLGLAAPTNYHTAELALLAADGEARAALVRRMFALRPAVLSLHYLDAGGDDLPALEAAAGAAGYRVVERSRRSSPTLTIDGTWADYESGLSKNLKSDVRRRRRRLEEEGAVALEITREADPDVLEEGFEIEGSGWKDAQGTAIRSRPETLGFYRELARRAADAGWLRLTTLRLDGRAIAFHFNLEADGVLYHLKGGFRTDCERFSPGKLLHFALVERAFEEGLVRYEFLGADESYKLQFANGSREFVLWEAFSSSPLGRAAWAHARARRLAKRTLARFR
jgi:CelD/BcsL family acetyltransferase involved in cellulose biosynthesis